MSDANDPNDDENIRSLSADEETTSEEAIAAKQARPRTPHQEELWQAWNVLKGEDSSETAKRDARDFIARSYEPLVRAAAQLQMRKSPYNFSMEDLVQAGNIGLLNAIDRFDPSLGNQFSTFAPLRIRGAILDEINTLDWTPRGVREKLRAVLKATEIHHRTNEVAPTDEELMGLTGLTKNQVREARLQLNKTYVTSIDASVFLALETRVGGSAGDFVGSGHNGPANTEDLVEHKQTLDVLYAALKKVLTEEEAQIVLLNFFEGMTLRDIATQLGIQPARVSLIRKNGLKKLRDTLGEEFIQEFHQHHGR